MLTGSQYRQEMIYAMMDINMGRNIIHIIQRHRDVPSRDCLTRCTKQSTFSEYFIDEPDLDSSTQPRISGSFMETCCKHYSSGANKSMVEDSEYEATDYDDFTSNETTGYNMRVTGDFAELLRQRLMLEKTENINDIRKQFIQHIVG